MVRGGRYIIKLTGKQVKILVKALWVILGKPVRCSSPRRLNQGCSTWLLIFNRSGSSLSQNTQTTTFPFAAFLDIIPQIPNNPRMLLGTGNTQLRRSSGTAPDGCTLKVKSHQESSNPIQQYEAAREREREVQAHESDVRGWWVWGDSEEHCICCLLSSECQWDVVGAWNWNPTPQSQMKW